MGGALIQRIEQLMDAPADAVEVERTLTDGYAEALSLEAERWRLHRQIGEAAAELEEGDGAAVRELSGLARRLAEIDGNLAGLRDRLAALRRNVRERDRLPAAENSTA